MRDGTLSQVADIGAFELAVNPEDEDFDSNPNSLVVRGNRTLVAETTETPYALQGE